MATVAAVGFLEWRESEVQREAHRLRLVPHQFAVHKILYAKEQCSPGFDFTGGGNCTGLIVYELPESTTRKIQQRGLTYFDDLGQTFAVERWGAFEEWQTTPVPVSREWDWGDRADGAPLPPPTLLGFLGFYGFFIDVDSKVRSDIDDSVSSPGSMFARDRYGVMIVIPAKSKIAYAYRN